MIKRISLILLLLAAIIILVFSACGENETVTETPEAVISDFGRQVAEEFLSQFSSIFLPIVIKDVATENLFLYDPTDIPPEYWQIPSDTPHVRFANRSAEWQHLAALDLYGNEIPNAPFIRNFGTADFTPSTSVYTI